MKATPGVSSLSNYTYTWKTGAIVQKTGYDYPSKETPVPVFEENLVAPVTLTTDFATPSTIHHLGSSRGCVEDFGGSVSFVVTTTPFTVLRNIDFSSCLQDEGTRRDVEVYAMVSGEWVLQTEFTWRQPGFNVSNVYLHDAPRYGVCGAPCLQSHHCVSDQMVTRLESLYGITITDKGIWHYPSAPPGCYLKQEEPGRRKLLFNTLLQTSFDAPNRQGQQVCGCGVNLVEATRTVPSDQFKIVVKADIVNSFTLDFDMCIQSPPPATPPPPPSPPP